VHRVFAKVINDEAHESFHVVLVELLLKDFQDLHALLQLDGAEGVSPHQVQN
jgi:hypothetical protein